MNLKTIYEDANILVIDKPAGIIVFPENQITEKTLIDYLLKDFSYLKNVGKPPRYGIVHRLDKDTSGILLVAKNNKALDFLQKQFQEGKIIKKYLALIVGNLKINQGKIETLIGKSLKNRKKQRAISLYTPGAKRQGLRRAITEYKVIKRFSASAKSYGGSTEAFGEGGKDYTLVQVLPKTGRKHQIRCHLAHLGHPIVGDKIYGFKGQPKPKNLKRHFLHAGYLKVQLPEGKEKELKSALPEDLKLIIKNLELIRI